MKLIQSQLTYLEKSSGKSIGDPRNPLLLSVNSSAELPYPGLLRSVLYVGFTPQVLEGLIDSKGHEIAYRMYQAFLKSFVALYNKLLYLVS